MRAWPEVFAYRDGHRVQWMRAGEAFFDELVHLIAQAKRFIHFQYYLVDPDATGLRILGALQAAAERGVEVNLVVDDFGSGKLTEHHVGPLVAAGVRFKRFEPYLSTSKHYLGRRMHHKIFVADDEVAVVGGLNAADRYRGTSMYPPWLDYAVRVEGPVCAQLSTACQRVIDRQFMPTTPKWMTPGPRKGILDPSGCWVRMRKNDWLRNRREVTMSYNRAARIARESLLIVGGYFIPGRRYRRLLAKAAERGVAIKVILTRDSDVPVVKHAADYLYAWMLRNKIRIFEMRDTMVHGKVAVADQIWSTIGSYNQNHLSAYLSIEMNLDIVNAEFSSGLHRHLEQVMREECMEITSELFQQTSRWHVKLRWWISYQLVRLSLRMLFVVNRMRPGND